MLERKKIYKGCTHSSTRYLWRNVSRINASTVIALRAIGKRLWDYKQKNTVKIVNLKIVNLKEGENSLLICCGVGGKEQWMVGRKA